MSQQHHETKAIDKSLSAILHATSDGVAVCDAGVIVVANDVLAHLISQASGADLTGRKIESLFAPDNAPRNDETTMPQRLESQRVHLRQDETQTVAVDLVVSQPDAGSNRKLYVFRLPPLLRGCRTQAEAQQISHLQRMKVFAELAASLIHELGQPLTASWGAAEVLIDNLRDSDVSGQTQRAGQIVAESNLRAARQFRRVWDFITTRRAKRETLKFDQVVKEAIEFVSSTVRHSGIALKQTLKSDREATLDPALLKLAITSLITRSVTALSGRLDSSKTVEVTTQNVGTSRVELTVSHDGQKLPAEAADLDIDVVVGEWYPALSICRTIIEENGGTLTVELSHNDSTVCYRASFTA